MQAGADGARDLGRGPEEALRAGDVEEGLVERDTLDERRERVEDVVDAPAVVGVDVVATRHEDGVGAQATGAHRRHRRPDAVGAGLVGAGRDHASVARATDDDRLALQRRIEQDLDRREERVHVDVQDRRFPPHDHESRPRWRTRSRIPHHVTSARASTTMWLDIFDWPRTRSVKAIGTSTIVPRARATR